MASMAHQGTQEMLHHLLGGHEAVLLEDPGAAGAEVVLEQRILGILPWKFHENPTFEMGKDGKIWENMRKYRKI